MTLKSFKRHSVCLYPLNSESLRTNFLVTKSSKTPQSCLTRTRTKYKCRQFDLYVCSNWIYGRTTAAFSGWGSNDAISMLPSEGEYQWPELRCLRYLSVTPPPATARVAAESSLEARTTWLQKQATVLMTTGDGPRLFSMTERCSSNLCLRAPPPCQTSRRLTVMTTA